MNLDASNYVVMANDLVKSKSNLSLNEIKLLRLTIMQIVKEETDFKTYQVSIKELAQLLNISSSNIYQDIDDMTTNLLKELVYIGDGNPKHKWKKFQWVSSCSYEDGIVTIKIHDDLKPYLLELKGYYTQYVLEDILLLKSIYSIRIYELIREKMKFQKVYADKKASVELYVDDIRRATGTEAKYEKMSMFRKRVVDSSISEFNKKLGYYIGCSPIKKGRKIIGFRFEIESKWSRK